MWLASRKSSEEVGVAGEESEGWGGRNEVKGGRGKGEIV